MTHNTTRRRANVRRPVYFDQTLISSLVLAHFLGTLFMRVGDGPLLATVVYAVCLVGPFLCLALFHATFGTESNDKFPAADRTQSQLRR